MDKANPLATARRVKQLLSRRVQLIRIRASRSINEPDIKLLFDEDYYLSHNPDIDRAQVDPYIHYLIFGIRENRRAHLLFDPDHYQTQMRDTTRPALEHYLRIGGFQGLDPIRMGFDSSYYLEMHPEVRRAGVNPLIHYLRTGAARGYDPSPVFNVTWYEQQAPALGHMDMDPLSHYFLHGFESGRTPTPRGPRWPPVFDAVVDVLARESKQWAPLRTRTSPRDDRITLITDSLDADGPSGDGTTSIIFAALWANETGRSLRVATRATPPDASGLHRVLSSVGIALHGPLEVAHASWDDTSDDRLPVGNNEVFITTSWWSTMSARAAIPGQRIVYMLQEDERAFYPIGPNWLRASQTMSSTDISILVNTEGLRRYLIDDGFTNLADRGFAFTPSAGGFLRQGRRLADRGDRPIRICFCARPRDPRDLYDYGLAAIDQAAGRGILDDSMEVVIMGANNKAVRLVNGAVPSLMDNMSWDDYREFLGTVDVGISLKASPHPGYPVLDMLASGAVVLTNLWPGKPRLADAADRVIEVSPAVEDLVDGIGQCLKMLRQVEGQPFQIRPDGFSSTWLTNLQDAVHWCEERVSRV